MTNNHQINVPLTDEKRRELRDRTDEGMRRRLAAGRSAFHAPFGFRRCSDETFEPMADELRVVRRAHEIFAANNGEGGCAAVEDALRVEGTHLSTRKIARALLDPAYVASQVTVTYRGSLYPLKPVELPVLVPLDLLLADQQRLEKAASQPLKRLRSLALEKWPRLTVRRRALERANDSQQRGNRGGARRRREDESGKDRPSPESSS